VSVLFNMSKIRELNNYRVTALRVAEFAGQYIVEYLSEEEAYSAFVDLYMSYRVQEPM
jgi:hypothetical protein